MLFPIAALLIFLGLTRIGPSRGAARHRRHAGACGPFASLVEAEPSARARAILADQPSRRRGRARRVRRSRPRARGRRSPRTACGRASARRGRLLAGRRSVRQSRCDGSRPRAADLGGSARHGQCPRDAAHRRRTDRSSRRTPRCGSSPATAVHHYSWFPAWLGVPLAAALFVWILVALRRAGPAAAAAIERRAVLLIAAPVALFVLVARLPGDLGQINLFEAGPVGHRDDAGRTRLVALARRRSDAWAARRRGPDRRRLARVRRQLLGRVTRAISLIFYPLTIVATFYLLAYLVGRSWPAIADRGADLRRAPGSGPPTLVSFSGRWSCCSSRRCSNAPRGCGPSPSASWSSPRRSSRPRWRRRC